MPNPYLSLSQLAQMLSAQGGVTVTTDSSGQPRTAWSPDTGRMTITIPALIPDDPVSVMTTHGFIDHESAHGRFTAFPATAGLSEIEHHLTNILEDVRVERAMGRLFPGCARNLHRVARHMFVDSPDAAMIPDADDPSYALASACAFILYTVRGYDDPAIAAHASDFPVPEDVRSAVLPLISRAAIDALRSTADARDLALRVAPLLPPPSPSPSDDSSPSPSDDSSPSPSDTLQAALRAQDMGCRLQRDVTQIAARAPIHSRQPTHTLSQEQARDRGLAASDTQPGSPATTYRERQLAGDCARLRTALQALIQSWVRNRESPARQSHRLNTRALHRVPLHDPRLFVTRTDRRAVNADITIIGDASGSMDGANIRLESRLMAALCHTLYTIPGAHVQAWAFQGRTLIPLLHRDQQPQTAPLYVQEATGGTPLGDVLGRVCETIPWTTPTRKIIIMITDGEVSDPANLHAHVQAALDSHATVIGIGLGVNAPAFCPTQVRVETFEDLPRQLFPLVRDALTAA